MGDFPKSGHIYKATFIVALYYIHCTMQYQNTLSKFSIDPVHMYIYQNFSLPYNTGQLYIHKECSFEIYEP